MTGGVLFAAFLIPVIMVFINWRKSKVHPQTSEVEEDEKERGDKVANEVQTEHAQYFGMKARNGTLSIMHSSSVNT